MDQLLLKSFPHELANVPEEVLTALAVSVLTVGWG